MLEKKKLWLDLELECMPKEAQIWTDMRDSINPPLFKDI